MLFPWSVIPTRMARRPGRAPDLHVFRCVAPSDMMGFGPPTRLINNRILIMKNFLTFAFKLGIIFVKFAFLMAVCLGKAAFVLLTVLIRATGRSTDAGVAQQAIGHSTDIFGRSVDPSTGKPL